MAIHAAMTSIPRRKALAVPIYQTVAYDSIAPTMEQRFLISKSKEFRYSRISNPTTACLERRVARWRRTGKLVREHSNRPSIMQCSILRG